MSIDFSARLKLKNVIAQIDHLLSAETPFENVPLALRQLRHVLQQFETRLEKAVKLKDADGIKAVAENINQKILDILPILGFIVRSTNVRNAFELLEPLNSISVALLGSRSRLMISSEWDYIPFAYPIGIEDLRNFIFIGLPSSEAANLLIAPLAGHEMGHAVWRLKNIDGAVSTTLEYHVENQFEANESRYAQYNQRYKGKDDLLSREEMLESIAASTTYAAHHAEEYFCDLIGLALFGQSYLRAFAYILAPGMGGRRSPKYPAQFDRAEVLMKYAVKLGVPAPADFSSQFTGSSSSIGISFELEMAENAVRKIIETLWDQANKIISDAQIPRISLSTASQIYGRFRSGAPASIPCSLGDIVNAAWSRFDEISSEGESFEKQAERVEQLNEMSLKTAEALEYRQRLGK